jgi:large subunit ribosomal protein L13
MKTYSTKASDIKREWHLIDASNQVLGGIATQAAGLLMGKHKALFCRHMDVGDNVVIINAAKIKVTGNKLQQKMYYRHSNYPGGFKADSLEEIMEKDPRKAIEFAIKGMLPHNRLESRMMNRLKVFVGDEHPYNGQIKVAVEEKAPATKES